MLQYQVKETGLTSTNKILPNICTFFIPESEYHQYKGLVTQFVPKEVRELYRQKLFKNTEQYVVMLDDDAARWL